MVSADNLNDGVTETLKQLKEAEAALLDFVVENGFSATEGSGLGRVFRLINRHIEGSRQVSNVGDQKPDFKELTDLKALDLEKLEAEYSGMAAALGMNINMAQKTTISDFFLHPRFDSVIGILRFPEISP